MLVAPFLFVLSVPDDVKKALNVRSRSRSTLVSCSCRAFHAASLFTSSDDEALLCASRVSVCFSLPCCRSQHAKTAGLPSGLEPPRDDE